MKRVAARFLWKANDLLTAVARRDAYGSCGAALRLLHAGRLASKGAPRAGRCGISWALERILREITWRTRVVGAFPDGQSALNLAAARLRHIAGTVWSSKRYLNIEPLRHQQMRGAITA